MAMFNRVPVPPEAFAALVQDLLSRSYDPCGYHGKRGVRALASWWASGIREQALAEERERWGELWDRTKQGDACAVCASPLACLQCGVAVPNTADAWVCEGCKEKEGKR